MAVDRIKKEIKKEGDSDSMNGKWIRTISALLIVGCMTGCGMGQSARDLAEGERTEYVAADDIFNNVSQTGDVVLPKQQDDTAQETIQALNTELFDGQSISIWKGKGSMLLVLKGDTLYLYDVVSAQIKGETKTRSWNLVEFYPYQDGYCLIGGLMNENPGKEKAPGTEAAMIEVVGGETECWGVFYDDSLNEKHSIFLNDLVEHADIAVWSVSPDGRMLGCYDLWKGLNIYDLQGQKISNPIKAWDSNSGQEIIGVDAIFFDADNSHVVFTGNTERDGKTAGAWSRCGIDGTGLETHTLKCDLGAPTGYVDKKLLFGEDSVIFLDSMGVVDTETGEEAYKTDIKDALPVSGPFFSDDATVFATVALGTNHMEVSVWQTKDFSLIHKEVIRDEREDMFYRSPQICLFPGLRGGIVCMGGNNDIPQKSVLLKY